MNTVEYELVEFFEMGLVSKIKQVDRKLITFKEGSNFIEGMRTIILKANNNPKVIEILEKDIEAYNIYFLDNEGERKENAKKYVKKLKETY